MSRFGSYVLKGAATLLLILLARKAFVDTDLVNYDSIAYHLPFAARFWRIAAPHQFAFLDHLEPVYRGFPLLGEVMQGFLWVFFDHIQAANLVALAGLVLYCYFGRALLQIPWHLTLLALLAVPLIQIHATGSLVDLPANLATAIVLLLAYRAYARTEIPPWRDIVVLVVAAGASANMKFLHTGLIALALVAVGVRLRQLAGRSEGPARAPMTKRLLFLGMTAPLVFATAVKNILLYKNPFYPFAVGFFGLTLPHTWAVRLTIPDYLSATPQPVRWLLSVFEFRAFDARRPYLWTGDQGYLPAGVPADRMGGYFFLFVIANLVCFGLLIWRLRSREARLAGVFFLLLSLITAAHTQSHELRYYMYWIIVLVTLNLYFLVHAQGRERSAFPLSAQQFGIVCLITIGIVIGLTRGAYIRPLTQPILTGYVAAIEPAIRAAIEKSPALCVVGRTNLHFLYADTFHPPLQYSVKAAQAESQCGSRVVVPAR